MRCPGYIAKDLVKIPEIHVLGPQQPVIGKIKTGIFRTYL